MLSSAYRLYAQAVPADPDSGAAWPPQYKRHASPTGIFPTENKEPPYTYHSENHKVSCAGSLFELTR